MVKAYFNLFVVESTSQNGLFNLAHPVYHPRQDQISNYMTTTKHSKSSSDSCSEELPQERSSHEIEKPLRKTIEETCTEDSIRNPQKFENPSSIYRSISIPAVNTGINSSTNSQDEQTFTKRNAGNV